jgi:hypothetical protein
MKQFALSQVVGMFLVLLASAAHADIFQWEYINPADPGQGKRQSTTLCPDGAGQNAVPNTSLYGNLTMAYLIAANLSGADFPRSLDPFHGDTTDLTDADFSQANLTNVNFGAVTLTGANFREANLANARFYRYFCGTVGPCRLVFATVTGADFTAVDARGAEGLSFLPADAITRNWIRPDGHIDGLELEFGGLLVVRDYDGDPTRFPTPLAPIGITVDQHLAMGPGGTLRMVFETDAWDSTISFAPGIPVTLGGTLELTFAADVNPANQLGRTFDLFNWTGVTPTGTFAVSSPYRWDLSNLYTTGQITLTAIPEPATFALAALGLLGSVVRVGRPQPITRTGANSENKVYFPQMVTDTHRCQLR